jgi:CheY-like chemotaxis protein
VTDNGIGISPEGLAHLFKPFSQVDSGLARQFEGTGLGLAMVKLLVDLHGGVVAVESAVGKGSCFTVWIPIRATDSAEVASPKPTVTIAPEGLAGTRTALVVESNYRSAELIRVQLEAENFTVIHARSSEEAMVIAQRDQLALITLDIMMPDVDGWAFLEQLKRIPSLGSVPVVIVSILADRTKGFALGAAAVMQSPVSRQDLYDTLVVLGLSPVSGDQRIRVLVVDDDPKAVDLIAIRIGGMASEIYRAFGGREAIEIARRELPDLIVLDLMMPDVNGFDVVEALNKGPATARIPVVVVTASAITAEERARLNGFVTTVMGKSGFDGDLFITEVRRAMAGHVGGG